MEYKVYYLKRKDQPGWHHRWVHRSETFKDRSQMVEFYRSAHGDDYYKELRVLECREMTQGEILGAEE